MRGGCGAARAVLASWLAWDLPCELPSIRLAAGMPRRMRQRTATLFPMSWTGLAEPYDKRTRAASKDLGVAGGEADGAGRGQHGPGDPLAGAGSDAHDGAVVGGGEQAGAQADEQGEGQGRMQRRGGGIERLGRAMLMTLVSRADMKVPEPTTARVHHFMAAGGAEGRIGSVMGWAFRRVGEAADHGRHEVEEGRSLRPTYQSDHPPVVLTRVAGTWPRLGRRLAGSAPRPQAVAGRAAASAAARRSAAARVIPPAVAASSVWAERPASSSRRVVAR